MRTEPGREAGRLVDGHWFVQDGSEPVWTAPRWIRALESQGYDRAAEGDPYFAVSLDAAGQLDAAGERATFGDIRSALRFAFDRVEAGPALPETLTIDCRTPSGRLVMIARGQAIIGMARGALEDEPIRTVEAPAD